MGTHSDKVTASELEELRRLIAAARAQLPAQHRALLEQIGTQDTVLLNWPSEVLALYETIKETPPAPQALTDVLAAWLQEVRVVAFNGQLLGQGLLRTGLDAPSVARVVEQLAWHEYGHALSVARATAEQRRQGPILLELLPKGLRAAINYPGAYRKSQVFDEVIANLYALLVGRGVRSGDYGPPEFLHPDLLHAFKLVIPWPPTTP